MPSYGQVHLCKILLITTGYTIKAQNAIYLPAGEGKVRFVDVRDVAAVAAKLLLSENNSTTQHENKAYVVTGSEPLSYSQVTEIISEGTGKKISYVDTEEDARKAMESMGIKDWLIDAILEEEFYNSKVGNRSTTTNTVEEIVGRKPASFAQFVRDYANFLSEY
jgi:uncharacterized protein YbjT (DUF2867 family)